LAIVAGLGNGISCSNPLTWLYISLGDFPVFRGFDAVPVFCFLLFTRARRSMPIASEISGKVTHIYADIGQPIPENGIFACLDDTFIKLDIASTENSIAQHGIDLKFLFSVPLLTQSEKGTLIRG
jgi:hypothetical protein